MTTYEGIYVKKTMADLKKLLAMKRAEVPARDGYGHSRSARGGRGTCSRWIWSQQIRDGRAPPSPAPPRLD